MNDEAKECRECGRLLPESLFQQSRLPQRWCKDCVRTYNRDWSRKNKDKAKLREWRSKQRPRRRASLLWRGAKKRAEKLGLEFSIEREWVEAKLHSGHCEVTGIPFNLAGWTDNPRKLKNSWSPSLDRKDPSLGYTPENTRLVIWMYNMAKSCWKHEDVMTMAKALVDTDRSTAMIA